MYKKSLRPFFTYILIFSIVWIFVIPWSIKGFLRRAFFTAQIPIFKLSSCIEHQQISQGVGAYPKDFWINQTRELYKENAYLKLQLAEQKEASDLAQRILQLNKVPLGEHFKCLVARVIHRSIEMWYQMVVIDKGFRDGVRVGQGVFCGEGVVGRIKNVDKTTAIVELITCPEFKMIVKTENENVTHVLSGFVDRNYFYHSGLRAKLSDVRKEDALLCPQTVETSALGQQFPPHMFVGRLVNVEKDGNTTVGIVQLGEHLKYLSEVGVLIPPTEVL